MKFFSLIKEDVHPSDDGKLIRAEEFSKLVDIIELLEKAQASAKTIQTEAENKAAQLFTEEKERGFQEGLEQFNAALLKFDEDLKALRFNLQQMVLPIALKAAKRIVGKELELFPDTIVDIVIQAIKPISESYEVTIFVNKDDKAHLDSEKSKLKELLPQAEVLIIQERADVQPGGCIIKTEAGMINATIENQWRALERAFERYDKSS